MTQSQPFNAALIKQEKNLVVEHAEFPSAEDVLFKAKSRVTWLKSGETHHSFTEK